MGEPSKPSDAELVPLPLEDVLLLSRPMPKSLQLLIPPEERIAEERKASDVLACLERRRRGNLGLTFSSGDALALGDIVRMEPKSLFSFTGLRIIKCRRGFF